MEILYRATYIRQQGHSQGGSGGSGEPPSKLMIFMTIALEKLRAEMYVLYNTPTFYAHSTQLKLASYSFVGYNKHPNS